METSLRFAHLDQANLSRVNLYNSAIEGISLSGTNLCEAIMPNGQVHPCR
jgi:uncharacterized protein YjbI with pentapeptide repeats